MKHFLKNWTKPLLAMLIWVAFAVYGNTPTFAQAVNAFPDKPVKTGTDILVVPKLDISAGMGRGRASDGTDLTVWFYTNDDGTSETSACGIFKSRSAASREFKHELDKATILIKKDTKKGPSGAVIGQRAVLTVTSPESDSGLGIVVWTEGKRFCRIASNRLPLAVDLEARFYNV